MSRVVITPANVADIAKLPDGTKAYLEGDFPTYRGPKKTWDKGIILDCSKATLNGWYWTKTAGVAFLNPTLREMRFPGLRLDDCQRITVTGARAESTSIKFVRCEEVVVEGCVITRAGTGVSLSECSGISVVRNAFRLSTSDGVQCAGCDAFLISGNTFDGTERPGSQHPDAIQFWSLPGRVTRNGRIIGNRVLGNCQGITSFDAAKGGIEDVLIADNDICIGPDFKWGIAMQNARRVVLRDNILRTMPGSKTKVDIDDRGLDGKWKTSGIIYEGRNTLDGKLIEPTKAA